MIQSPVVPPSAPKPAAAPAIVAPAQVDATPAVVEKVADEKVATTPLAEKIAKAIAESKAPAKTAVEEKPAVVTKPVDAKEEPDDAAIKAEIEAKTKGMDGAAKQAFADLQYEKRDLKRKLKAAEPLAQKAADLETKLQAAEAKIAESLGKTSDPKEVAELKARLEAAEARDTEREQYLLEAKVEKTDAFRNAVTKPLEKVQTKVDALAKKYELKPGELMSALKDTSENQSDLLETAMESMNSVDKTNFLRMVDAVAEAGEKEAVLRGNAKEALAKIEEKQSGQSAEQSKAAKAARLAAHDANWKALTESLPDVLKTFDGDDEVTTAWNAALTDAAKTGQELDYSALKPAEQSEVALLAAVHPLVIGKLQAVEAQLTVSEKALAEANAELEKFRAKVPGGASSHQADAKGEDPAYANLTGAQRVAAKIAAAVAR